MYWNFTGSVHVCICGFGAVRTTNHPKLLLELLIACAGSVLEKNPVPYMFSNCRLRAVGNTHQTKLLNETVVRQGKGIDGRHRWVCRGYHRCGCNVEVSRSLHRVVFPKTGFGDEVYRSLFHRAP